MQAGANWDNGVRAGARTVNVNNYPWNVNTNIGSRLACENRLNPRRCGITVPIAVTDCQIITPCRKAKLGWCSACGLGTLFY
jgi:hypothetical protein